MPKNLFFAFCILQSFFLIYARADRELLFVQILFRHGDRSPINLYPNDPNPESFWQEGLGKLTMLGRKQHYALGKYLRRMYADFITSNPNEVNVTSSDCDRCMRSAETNLASFFAPSSEWQFEEDAKWQPIPIFYIPKDEDKFLETESYCPAAFAEQINVLHSPEGQAFVAKHKNMFGNLTLYSGSDITDWTTASYLHDVLAIEERYNLTVPAWARPWWKELQEVADLSFYWSFNSPLLHRLRAGPLLQRMVEMMESKIAGQLPLQKVHIYSAHDTNVAVVLDALDLFNMKQPPYCATLLFELHSDQTVRLLYQNASSPEKEIPPPRVLVLRGCPEFCPLALFKNLTRGLFPVDWERECQLSGGKRPSFIEELQHKNVAVGVFFGAISLLIVAVTIYSVWRLYTRNRDKYSYHLMPLN